MKIKICGITSIDDAEAAIRCGVDYIGIIFVKGTPRYIDLERAQAIASYATGRVNIVGVFQNHSPEEIDQIAETVPLDLAQLHGSESPEQCKRVGLPVIKAMVANFGTLYNIENNAGAMNFEDQLSQHIELYLPHCEHILIDKCKGLSESKWPEAVLPGIAKLENRLGNYFLAGGMNEAKVPSVLKAVNPFCLDLSSAVEISPGKKSHELIKRFCDAVKRLTKGQALGEATTC